MTDINKVVINPALKELSPYFEGLTVEKYSNKKKGQRGRPKIDGFIFSYKAEPKKERIKEPTQESIAKVTDWERHQDFAPNCHRSIYKNSLKTKMELTIFTDILTLRQVNVILQQMTIVYC